MDGFDLESPLVCEGIIGDGCGGGRIFYIEQGRLSAYDPQSKEVIVLQKHISDAVSLSKKGCLLTIVFKDKSVVFDLSSIKA